MLTNNLLSVSVVINTDGRAKSLPDTIDALRRMDYPEFEICVVCGPTPDGTRELARDYESKGWIKAVHCPERNLSQSRNVGIAMSAGDVVAFIDDDAIPEPEWLDQLVRAYDASAVKGAGGLVYDHTGYRYQYRYAVCDRLGNAVFDVTEPATAFNFPFSNLFPYIQGANSSFDRAALVSIGGFDEEFEFYLDETDVCCRLVDAGYTIRQLDGATVHHKYLPSSIRNVDRITVVKYPVLKNKIYFSLVNNHGHFGVDEALSDGLRFFQSQRQDLERHVQSGRISATTLEDFDEQAEKAWRTGLSRGLSGKRRTRPASFFASASEFVRCPRIVPEGERRTFVFLSQSFPPLSMGGSARYTVDITRAIADLGHNVHVITRSDGDNTVDFERGVWVHRLVAKGQIPETLPTGETIPHHIWNTSRTLLEEVERIAKARKVDAIEAASWDCENIAAILDGRFPVATNVITTLTHWLDTHEELRSDEKWMSEFGRPMQAAERVLFEQSDLIIAASGAIVASIEERYALPLVQSPRVSPCVHGMEDMRPLPRRAPHSVSGFNPTDGVVRILFLGRLELRKGIDLLLLHAAPSVLRAFPNVEFWIAGDDSLVLDGGLTARRRFEDAFTDQPEVLARVRFFGNVSEEELHWLYANCDIYTSPSRFESFGLIFVEAMMFSKPSVGTRTSGIAEILEHDVTGLMAEVDDAASLEAELKRMSGDADLRRRLGEKGREQFETVYEASVVAKRRTAILSGLSREPFPDALIHVPASSRPLDTGTLLMPGDAIEINVGSARDIYVSFFAHAWSGIAEIQLDGRLAQRVDLFHPTGSYRTVRILPSGARLLRIIRCGHKAASAHDTEVIFHQAARCVTN